MLAPGSVLQPFSYIPPGQVWAGNPARYVRDVEEDEKQFIRDTAQESHDLGNAHADEYALEYPMVSACTTHLPAPTTRVLPTTTQMLIFTSRPSASKSNCAVHRAYLFTEFD